MTEAHLPLLVDLDSDPEVLRHILGRARSVQEVHDHWGHICADTDADAVGLGRWVGSRRGDGDFTEGATALLDHGFAGLGLNLMWAETMAVNEPSRRVMARLGMRHVGTDVRDWEHPLPGAEQGEVRYDVTSVEWLGRRPREDR